MRITVEDYDDFVDKVFEATGDELEIVLTAAAYEDGTFNVDCDSDFEQVTMSAEDVATFTDSSVSLCAKNIEVENLLFDTPRLTEPIFSARATDGVNIKGCSWLRGNLNEQPSLSVLHIEPRSTSTLLTLTDSWLIGNQTGDKHQIIGFRTSMNGAFATMKIENTAFIDNTSDYVIAALAADTIEIRDCFIMLRDAKTVFLGARTKGANITFTDCVIVTPSLKQIVTQWASDTTPGDFKAATFTDCHIYTTDTDEMPNGIRLMNTRVKEIAPLSGFEAWSQQQEAKARAGEAPDAEALQDSLNLP